MTIAQTVNAEHACIILFGLIALSGLIGAILSDPEFTDAIVGPAATQNVPYPQLNTVLVIDGKAQ